MLTNLDAAKPFFIGKQIWDAAMSSIGAKAEARLHVLNAHWRGEDLQYLDQGGAIVVVFSDGVGHRLSTDFKRKEDFDALLTVNRHLAPQYLAGIPVYAYGDKPTQYRRHGFRLAWPITCNVMYSDKWDQLPDARQAIDLGAISA